MNYGRHSRSINYGSVKVPVLASPAVYLASFRAKSAYAEKDFRTLHTRRTYNASIESIPLIGRTGEKAVIFMLIVVAFNYNKVE